MVIIGIYNIQTERPGITGTLIFTDIVLFERIDIRISPYLQDLFDAARTDGVYPIVASGYRTTEKQQDKEL